MTHYKDVPTLLKIHPEKGIISPVNQWMDYDDNGMLHDYDNKRSNHIRIQFKKNKLHVNKIILRDEIENIDWLIDWIEFYAVSAKCQPYDDGICEMLKFPGGLHEPSLLRNPVDRSFACQWGR